MQIQKGHAQPRTYDVGPAICSGTEQIAVTPEQENWQPFWTWRMDSEDDETDKAPNTIKIYYTPTTIDPPKEEKPNTHQKKRKKQPREQPKKEPEGLPECLMKDCNSCLSFSHPLVR